MNLNITGISSSLGGSIENRFGKTILPIKDLVSQGLSTYGYHKFRHDVVIDYTWSENSAAHHAKFGVAKSDSLESLSYIVDSGNSISGLESGSAKFQMTVDYPSGEVFGQLNFIRDYAPNSIKAKSVVVTGDSVGEHYVTGSTYTSEDFITRPFIGNVVSDEYVLIGGYKNLEPEYLRVYVGGLETNGFVNPSEGVVVKIPSFTSVQKDVVIEVENAVNRVTGGYFAVVSSPEILSVDPSTATWGDSVVISGNNFVDVTGVSLNGLQIPSFTNPNDNQVSFIVPEDIGGLHDIKICATGGCSE